MLIRIVEFIERFLLRLGVASGFLTLLTMLIIVADVVGRGFFNKPIPGGNEFAVLIMVGLIFLGMAAAQQKKHNFSIDLVTGFLPPGPLRVANFIATAVSTAVCGLLAWLTIDIAHAMTLSGVSSYGVIAFPIWPSRIILAIGLVCLTLQFFFDFLRAAGVLPEKPDEEEKASI